MTRPADDRMQCICLDVEGVILPELWMALGRKFGLDALLETTRDTPDLDRLMAQRIGALRAADIRYRDVRAALEDVQPLEGAREFLGALCQARPLMLVSDSFYELLLPQLRTFGRPAVTCHNLLVDDTGFIAGWRRLSPGHKPAVVRAFQKLGFQVAAAGDSFNDIGMLEAADAGYFIHAPPAIRMRYPDIPACATLEQLKDRLLDGCHYPPNPMASRGSHDPKSLIREYGPGLDETA